MGKSHNDWLDELLMMIDSSIDFQCVVTDDEQTVHYVECWKCRAAANRTRADEPPFRWEVDFSTLGQVIREAREHISTHHSKET